MLKEVVIKAIAPVFLPSDSLFTLYLISKEDLVAVPIEISDNAARSLMLALENKDTPRPHVHDTMRRVINALGGRISGAVINFYADGIYYAVIKIERDGKSYDVDAKLTDAISVAIRSGTPVFIENGILEKNGISLEGI